MGATQTVKHGLLLAVFLFGMLMITVGIDQLPKDPVASTGLIIFGILLSACGYLVYKEGRRSVKIAAYGLFAMSLIGFIDTGIYAYEGEWTSVVAAAIAGLLASIMGYIFWKRSKVPPSAPQEMPLSRYVGAPPGSGTGGVYIGGRELLTTNQMMAQEQAQPRQPGPQRMVPRQTPAPQQRPQRMVPGPAPTRTPPPSPAQVGMVAGYQKSREDLLDSYREIERKRSQWADSIQMLQQMQRKEIKKGDTLRGINEYAVEEEPITTGGMGIVYIAYDRTFDERVAMKTFYEESLWDEETKTKFLKEAQLWIDMGYLPNVVHADRIETIQGKTFIVMEFVNGGDLVEWIQRGLSLQQALEFAFQICIGLDFAYEKMGLVHRDLKPGNVLISEEKDQVQAKVSDFGLATATHAVGTGLTARYSSPEQLLEAMEQDIPVDIRSDIYSVGLIIYMMVTGEFPFVTRSEEETVLAHLLVDPPSPMLVNAAVPADVNDLIMRCLAKEPTDRYSSFAEVRDELKDILELYTGYDYTLQDVDSDLDDLEHDVYTLNNKGVALMELGKYDEALVCFDEAIERNPDFISPWLGKGQTLRLMGHNEESLYCNEQAIRIDPYKAKAWLGKGQTLLFMDRPDESIEFLQKAIELDPVFIMGHVSLGDAYRRIGQHDMALQQYDMALGIEPDHTGAYIGKVQSFREQGRIREALAAIDAAIETNPQMHILWQYKGSISIRGGRPRDAIQHYQRAIYLEPKDKYSLNGLATAYKEIGDIDNAVRYYTAALDMDPEYYPALINLGRTFVDLDRLDDAHECYNRAIEIEPEAPAIWMEMGTLYNAYGDPRKALEYHDRALQLDDRDATIWVNRAIALVQLDMYDEATASMAKVIELDPPEAELWALMGQIQEQFYHDSQQARYFYERASQLGSR